MDLGRLREDAINPSPYHKECWFGYKSAQFCSGKQGKKCDNRESEGRRAFAVFPKKHAFYP